MAGLPAFRPDSVYMTAGRDYTTASRYEFVIGAYEPVPSCVALDGEPLPITLHRETGFPTNAAAKRAGMRWAQAHLGL